jgi:sulfur transfer complex TusBCD TusB component (DsrH family)
MRASSEAVDHCRSHFEDGDAVLFLDDGVMQITSSASPLPDPLNSSGDPLVFYSAVDLEARGLSGLARSVGAIVLQDSDIAGLVQSYGFCLTWK